MTVKGTINLNPSHYLSVRYGRNNNSQPYGATLRNAPSAWSTSKNEFNSFNVNHNWVIGGTEAERSRVPVRGLQEQHPAQQLATRG